MLKPTDTSLIAELKRLHREDGCLLADRMSELAKRFKLPESHVYGVATFYSLLSLEHTASHTIRVCDSISCHLGKSGELLQAAETLLGVHSGETTADKLFHLETTGCLGACAIGPAALVDNQLYERLDIQAFTLLINALKAGIAPKNNSVAPSVRIISVPVLVGTIMPKLITEGLTSEAILTEIEASGLTGRGGAAFPVGRKWRLCAAQPCDEKFVVCNADESEPGTFKDRWLLAERPGLVILGMVLAALAIGAHNGYIYLRGEYEDILGGIEAEVKHINSPSFEITIIIGAGAYICGEETALLESIEGFRGVPRLRPPYPPVSGLFDCPTVINNVETFANVPVIISRGSEWFRHIGTQESTGTKLLCISGDVARPGIIECPLGISLNEVLLNAGASDLKAALVGGASGRLVPTHDFGRKLCYEDLSPGSGAIVAIGQNRSIRDLAANLMAFFQHESCGECSICRIGTSWATEILTGERTITEPPAQVLQSIASALSDGSRCGLGQAAAVALMDALELFPEEFSQGVSNR